MVCQPVRGDNPRALASGLSPIKADKPWYNYFILPSSFLAKVIQWHDLHSFQFFRKRHLDLYKQHIHKGHRSMKCTSNDVSCSAVLIGVGRGGGGQGGGGGGAGPPPNNLRGGPTYPLAPPNNPPTFSFNFYVKREKVTNVPS